MNNEDIDVVDAFFIDLVSDLPVTVDEIKNESQKDLKLRTVIQLLKQGKKLCAKDV